MLLNIQFKMIFSNTNTVYQSIIKPTTNEGVFDQIAH